MAPIGTSSSKSRGMGVLRQHARRFGSWFTAELAAKNLDVSTCAAALLDQPGQVHADRLPAAVASWAAGNTLPSVHALPGIAAVLDVDLAVVVTAAGRPAADASRLRFITDPAGSLAGRLFAWREAVDLTPSQAADLAKLHPTAWYRLEAGSRLPGFRILLRLADLMGVPCADLAEACSPVRGTPSDLMARARLADQPYAAQIRRQLDVLGLTAETVAQATGIAQLPSYATGRSRPGARTAMQLATLLGVDLRSSLESSDLTEADADLIATALDQRAEVTDTVGAQLGRLRREAGLSRDALAEMVQAHPTAVSRWEHDHVQPGLPILANYSRLFPEAAPDLVAAWSAT